MKLLVSLLIVLYLSFVPVSADNIEEKIINDTQIQKAEELIPSVLEEKSDINFNPSGSASDNGMNAEKIFKHLINLAFKDIGEELRFILSLFAVFVINGIAKSFAEGFGNGGLNNVIHFSTSVIICSILIAHVNNALSEASAYTEELSVFVKGLLPFMGSLSLVGGEISTSAVTQAAILSSITLLQTVLLNIAIPTSKVVLAFSIVGYITKIPLGALSEFLTAFTTKLITISFGILCIIIYFQNTVSTVTDSLALRSVKLAVGNFIPIVGGFVSEASGTLVSGIRLVKSTFGVFAICVLIYTGAIPIVNFSIRKFSLKLVNVIAKLTGSAEEARITGELIGVYNILSAIMIASLCFFIFAISVFIKSEVG